MAAETNHVGSSALARATALAGRARELRHAQQEVQLLATREVEILAHAAAAFFELVPLAEFTRNLLPPSARALRRIRHRILHRKIDEAETDTAISVLLLGHDGGLRFFTARAIDARELLQVFGPNESLPAGVLREVFDWTPRCTIDGFRPFEILERLTRALDVVEEHVNDAVARVRVQRDALARGDIAALLPSRKPTSTTPSVELVSEAAQFTPPTPTAEGAVMHAAVVEREFSSSLAVASDPAVEFFFEIEAHANDVLLPSQAVGSGVKVEHDADAEEWPEPNAAHSGDSKEKPVLTAFFSGAEKTTVSARQPKV
jgi:hypothetical protein